MTKHKSINTSRGAKLKHLRKTKGYSLEEVYEKTKIRISVLENLEADATKDMPSAYLRGLLKVYCNALGVDPKEFIEDRAEKQEPVITKLPVNELKPKKETPPPVKRQEVRLSTSKSQAKAKPVKLKPVVFVVGLIVLTMIAFRIGKTISIHRASRSERKISSLKIKDKAVSTSPASDSIINKPSLGIRAKESCWIEVKVDGKTISKSVLKRGDFEFWEAKQRIEFSLGNAAGVDVEVNGKPLPTLGRRGQVIKNIVITKEGLQVPK